MPPRVGCTLTRLGRTLIQPVSELAMWAQRHRPETERAREDLARAARAGR